MSRSGPRPSTWIVKDPLGHEQHLAWHRMRAQARFRNEDWDLSFEEFQDLWSEHWHQRGRGVDNYCLVRNDYDLPWSIDNVLCVKRSEHLKRKYRKLR